VLVDRPDVRGREAILGIHVRTVKLAENVDLALIAARTGGFAGADLGNLVNEAALLAARRDKAAVDRADFDEAIDRVVAGLEKKRAMSGRVRRIIAVHEVGHAIVASMLPGMDPVHKVSIVGRGFGALGYTMQLPTEDRYLRTKVELQNELAVLLGGRTAESIAFGEVSTGDQNDLERATDIARAMVTEYGMSDAIGPVNHDARGRSTFLETNYAPERGVYAEDTARVIDAEIKRLIEDAEARARQILTDGRQALDLLTERLLEKEVIEGDELRALLIPAALTPAGADAGD
jgi:cell division protease FtsH